MNFELFLLDIESKELIYKRRVFYFLLWRNKDEH
jgi:hypothetical protein